MKGQEIYYRKRNFIKEIQLFLGGGHRLLSSRIIMESLCFVLIIHIARKTFG